MNGFQQRHIVSVPPVVGDPEYLTICLNECPFRKARKRSRNGISSIIKDDHKRHRGIVQARTHTQFAATQVDRSRDIRLTIIRSCSGSIEIDLINGRGCQHHVSRTDDTGPRNETVLDGQNSRGRSDRTRGLQRPNGVAIRPDGISPCSIYRHITATERVIRTIRQRPPIDSG